MSVMSVMSVTSKIKTQGAVFTPKWLVDDMLSSIPRSFLVQPIRWLEPSAGSGNFVTGIQALISNQNLRNQTIDVYEIDPEFCRLFEERTTLPIKCEDFLTARIEDKYDIIIGNPPYQKINKKNGKARGGRSQLYLEFVDKCLTLLKPRGLLIFVHPPNWRKPGSKYLHVFLNTMNLLRTELSLKRVFDGVSVSVDWYCVQNCEYENSTTINHEQIAINPAIPFLPNEFTTCIQELVLNALRGKHYECIISCYLHAYTKRDKLSKESTDIFSYPIYNTSANPWVWSSIPHIHQHTPKVIMSTSGKLKPFYDAGEYGTTQNSMFIVVESEREARHIIKRLDELSDLLKLCQWGLFRTERTLISLLGF